MVASKNKEKKKPTVELTSQKTLEESVKEENNLWTMIAKQIKEKSTCLEVGCKEGLLGEILSSEKKCKVYGIEESKTAMKIAKKRNCYQEIYSFKIEESKKTEYQKFLKESPQYDYIILANILNHVENPTLVLVEFSKKLKRNGKIIVSLPNICHIDNCKSLINRETITGENKSTHFFSKQQFFDFFKMLHDTYELSLHVSVVGKVTKEPTEHLEKYPNLYKLLNKDKEASVIEYIYEIGKKLKIEEETEEKKRDYFELLEKELQDRVLYSQQLKLQRQENFNLLDQIRIEGEVNQKLTKENEALQKELAMMLESKSWKMTKPFRSIKNYFENRR